MKKYYFSIQLSYVECENLYDAAIRTIVLTARTGERVQIPCNSLRPFVEPTGIKGNFCLTVNKDNKIQSFTRSTE
ncbi:DUF2835 family protein [Glaciecola sp. MH2013]|uniref:DUF2835 family protein n=1 Tax=Glaciecola sp. MH2013 TaxID=2785524 RepID=UPI00189E00AA|nr:DUF2835 family protein [Glaciecola sp. MH2013]